MKKLQRDVQAWRVELCLIVFASCALPLLFIKMKVIPGAKDFFILAYKYPQMFLNDWRAWLVVYMLFLWGALGVLCSIFVQATRKRLVSVLYGKCK